MPNPIWSATHVWVVAATVPIPADRADTALEDGFLIADGIRIDVLDLYCSQCRRSYDDVRSTVCEVAVSGNEHLRGGPIGTRRSRKCGLHKVPWHDCEHLHDEPTNYGRPPMPPVAVGARGR